MHPVDSCGITCAMDRYYAYRRDIGAPSCQIDVQTRQAEAISCLAPVFVENGVRRLALEAME